mmetsp:Transcript_6172/g.10747  ORF Transcript_6172/g.10747 Transcript_6172/m.10747 type:complete len:755 (-) Transcript_6172:49-2313(-)
MLRTSATRYSGVSDGSAEGEADMPPSPRGRGRPQLGFDDPGNAAESPPASPRGGRGRPQLSLENHTGGGSPSSPGRLPALPGIGSRQDVEGRGYQEDIPSQIEPYSQPPVDTYGTSSFQPRPGAVRFQHPFGMGEFGVVAFHYPGRNEACDDLSGASFLSNNFEVGHGAIRVQPRGGRQSLRFNSAAEAVQAVGGDWSSMREILASKFSPDYNIPLCNALLDTQDAFLLHYNPSAGRNGVWSDTGTADNTLGMQLMLLRDQLGGTGQWSTFLLADCQVNDENGEHQSMEGERSWKEVLKSAKEALQQQLPGSHGTRTRRSQEDASPRSHGGRVPDAYSVDRNRMGRNPFEDNSSAGRSRGGLEMGDALSPRGRSNQDYDDPYNRRGKESRKGYQHEEDQRHGRGHGFGGANYREGSSSRAVSRSSAEQQRQQDRLGRQPTREVIIARAEHTRRSPLDSLANVTYEEANALLNANEAGLREFFNAKNCGEIGEALYREGVTGTSLYLMSIVNIERDLGLNLGEQLALKACIKKLKTVARTKHQAETIFSRKEFKMSREPFSAQGLLSSHCNDSWMPFQFKGSCKPPLEYYKLPDCKYELNELTLRVITHEWCDQGGPSNGKPRKKKFKKKGLFGWWCGYEEDSEEPQHAMRVDNIDLHTIKDVDFEVKAPYKVYHQKECMDTFVDHLDYELVTEAANIRIVYEDEGGTGQIERKTMTMRVDPEDAEEVVRQLQVHVHEARMHKAAEEELHAAEKK